MPTNDNLRHDTSINPYASPAEAGGYDDRQPFGVGVWRDGGLLHLQGMVGSAHDGRLVRADGEGTSPETVGLEVAERLLAQGARALIDAHVE